METSYISYFLLTFGFLTAVISDDFSQDTKLAWRHGKWPNARVPYVIDSKFNEQQRSQVFTALANYHTKTCVRFVPKQDSDRDYVFMTRDENVCGLAEFCVKGGQQFAKFGGSCAHSGVMTHELGHTLCFSHEQLRPDRDDYISWNTSVCTPQGKVDAKDWTTLDLLYDYVSLQHYEDECYNGCIKPKISGVTKCGSGGTLSVLDAEKINAFYECPGCYSYRYRPGSKTSVSPPDPSLVRAGTDLDGTNPLYPCRTYHNGDIVPGKADAYGNCYVPYNGAEYKYSSNFEILTNPKKANLVWRHVPPGSPVPGNAIPGGRTAERVPLYIGRCTISGSEGRKTTLPGKYHPQASPKLYVPFGGKEYVCDNFELLLCEG